MSTAPQGWQNPKTNWTPSDPVGTGDLNRIEGNIQAIESGSRTIDPNQAPASNVGTLRQLLDWFANRIKAIAGKTNWYDPPDTTLAGAKAHIDNTTTAHGGVNAEAILAKLKTVDGMGSGLDADKVDGCDAGTGANNVLKLDSNGKVPLETIPASIMRTPSELTGTISLGSMSAGSYKQFYVNHAPLSIPYSYFPPMIYQYDGSGGAVVVNQKPIDGSQHWELGLQAADGKTVRVSISHYNASSFSGVAYADVALTNGVLQWRRLKAGS